LASEGDSTGTTGWAAFRHRDFCLLFSVRILNGVATNIFQIAVGWEMWRITHEELILGLVGIVSFAPNLLLFLVAGTIADRFPRERVLAVSFGVQAVAALGLLLIDAQPEPSVTLAFVVIFLNGIGRTFAQPATQALLPNVVPKEHFPNAVAWASSGQQISVIMGPLIGGFLLLLGATVDFGATAAAFTLNIVLALSIRPIGQLVSKGPVTLDSLFAGLRYIFSNQIILGAMSLDLFAFMFGSANALMPVFATDILNIGEVGLGMLRASIAVGATLCGLVLTRVPIKRHAGVTLLITVAVYGTAMSAFGAAPNIYFALPALFVAGAADLVSVFIRQTLVQLATPDEMRGRVTSVHGVFTNASGQLGDFRAGSVAAALGVIPAVMLGGMMTLALAPLWGKFFPKLRHIDALEIESLRRGT